MPLLEIDGDVGPRTGHIETDHTVIVHGDVRDGFNIHSGGDVFIDGLIEDSVVSANGNLVVSGGILAGDQPVSAGNVLYARFIAERTIRADRIAVPQEIRSCDIIASGDVIAESLSGGRTICGGNLCCTTIGAPQGAVTTITVGIDILGHQRAVAAEQARRAALAKDRQCSIDQVAPEPLPSFEATTPRSVIIGGTLSPPTEISIGSHAHWQVPSQITAAHVSIHQGEVDALALETPFDHISAVDAILTKVCSPSMSTS
ncbi:MAG: FapA family protein [Planctomycetota bacterium]|jgi:hypothetical protein